MELHHKLRRDPSWHPNACNICGQLGHQAANCTNGTINWRQIYGDEAFVLRDPVYWSDIRQRQESRKVDVADLKKRAEEYAKMKLQSMGVDYDGMSKAAQEMMGGADEAPAAQPAAVAAAVAGGATVGGVVPMDVTPAEAKPEAAAAAPAAEEAPMPAGWAAAQDAQGRTYFWHKKTQKVQWERPTEETPVE